MNKKILGVFASLLVVAILALPMSSAYATSPTPISFTIKPIQGTGVTTTDPCGKSDTSIVTKSNVEFTCTGDIVGDGYFNNREVVRGADKTSTGLYVIYGTVDGKSGTLYIKTSVNTRDPQPSKWRIVGGTDDFANLHGPGTFAFVPGTGLVFTGQAHFDP